MFKDYLINAANEIEVALGEILDHWKKDVNYISPKLTRFADIFIKACEGGKRLRGGLVKLGYEMAGGEDIKTILRPAAAFEIFQTAILAHDDVIDKSPLRRGKPTVYQALGGDHYGMSQAIGLGDAGLFLATKLIADSDFKDSHKNQALSFFCKIFVDTALGEILDVELPHIKQAKKEDIITIFKLKTAYYTIIGPLTLGAILAGGSQSLQDQIHELGLNLGIAFQIQDDILGVFGSEEALGKSVTSDIEEGKITLLLSQALEDANTTQRNVLERYYGNGPIDKKWLEQIRGVFVATGALDETQRQAVKYVNQAKKVIGSMEISNTHRILLFEMADFLVERVS